MLRGTKSGDADQPRGPAARNRIRDWYKINARSKNARNKINARTKMSSQKQDCATLINRLGNIIKNP